MDDLQYLHSVKQMPMLPLPVATVIVPLKGGRILISPGSMLTKDDLRKAGAVTDIVAPNLLHTAGVQRAIEVFPNAKVWGPIGVRTAKPKIPWTGELTEAAWPFGAELPLIHLRGMPQMEEVVFVHSATRTLLVTDLAFNLKDAKGLGAFVLLHIFGTYRKFAVSRLFLRMVKDKEAFERSLGELFAHDFERVVVSHGAIEPQGRELLLASLRGRGYSPRA